MYNATNYFDKTVDTFEILGCYVVDVFYNHLYDKAKTLHVSGKCASVTEGYKTACTAYLMHFKRADMFNQTIKNVYNFFNLHSPVPILSHSDWVDRMTTEFVPTDFWPSLNSKRKDHILGIVIEGIFRKFAAYILTPRSLMMIIDNHNDKTNITFLQDRMLSITMEERECMYQKFVKPLNGAKDGGLTERLRADLQKEITKTIALKTALEKAATTIRAMTEQVTLLTQTKQYLLDRSKDLYNRLQTATAMPVAPAIAAPVVVQDIAYLDVAAPIEPVSNSLILEPSLDEFDMIDDLQTVEEPEETVDEMKAKALARVKEKRKNNIELEVDKLF
jgi:hypothetical protein